MIAVANRKHLEYVLIAFWKKKNPFLLGLVLNELFDVVASNQVVEKIINC